MLHLLDLLKILLCDVSRGFYVSNSGGAAFVSAELPCEHCSLDTAYAYYFWVGLISFELSVIFSPFGLVWHWRSNYASKYDVVRKFLVAFWGLSLVISAVWNASCLSRKSIPFCMVSAHNVLPFCWSVLGLQICISFQKRWFWFLWD